jgi:hypothetical protein
MPNLLGLNFLKKKIFFGLQNKDFKQSYHLIGKKAKHKINKLFTEIQELGK